MLNIYNKFKPKKFLKPKNLLKLIIFNKNFAVRQKPGMIVPGEGKIVSVRTKIS